MIAHQVTPGEGYLVSIHVCFASCGLGNSHHGGPFCSSLGHVDNHLDFCFWISFVCHVSLMILTFSSVWDADSDLGVLLPQDC